jgi:hypothetical protein
MPLVLELGFIGIWVALCASALSLSAFSLEEARGALRRSSRTAAIFWEATARNAWIAGVLGAVLNFVLALGGAGTPVGGVLTRLALAFVPAIQGIALAGACSVPAVKLRHRLLDAAAAGRAGPHRPRALGLLFFAALVVPTLWNQHRTAASPTLLPLNLIFHWPAVLVVLGAALGFRVLVGGEPARRVGPAVVAGAGTLGCLIGVVSVLLAVVDPDLPRLTAAVSYILTAAFVALLAMALIANPVEDRAVVRGEVRDYSWASRAAWVLFPLVSLIFLFVAFLVVTTPFPMKHGK